MKVGNNNTVIFIYFDRKWCSSSPETQQS